MNRSRKTIYSFQDKEQTEFDYFLNYKKNMVSKPSLVYSRTEGYNPFENEFSHLESNMIVGKSKKVRFLP